MLLLGTTLTPIGCIDSKRAEWTAPQAEEGQCTQPNSVAPNAGSDFEVVTTYGLEPGEELSSIAGVDVRNDTVFMLDSRLPKVILFDSLLRVISKWGRSGQGPGEFSGRGVPWPPSDFVAAGSESVTIYDEAFGRIAELTTRGRAIRQVLPTPDNPIVPGIGEERIRLDGVTLYIGNGEFKLPSDRAAEYAIIALAGTSVDTLLRLPLRDFPQYRSRPFLGWAEARYLWDISNECLVHMDGHTPRLRISVLNGEPTYIAFEQALPDTVRLRKLAELEYEQGYPLLGLGGAPPPKRLKIFDDMILDPWGVVWVKQAAYAEDYAPSAPTHLVRIDLGSGKVERLVSPGFPKAFLSDGSYIAVRRSEFDEPYLVRISSPRLSN